MSVTDLLLEPLTYDFMSRALVTTVVASVVCAVLSVGWSSLAGR